MQKFFFVRMDGKYVKINFSEIIYVEGCKNYLKIVTPRKNYLVLITLKRMEQLLPASLFKRVHKSYIVSLADIVEFDSCNINLSNTTIPIGEHYKGVLEDSVTIAQGEINEPVLAITSYVAPMTMYSS